MKPLDAIPGSWARLFHVAPIALMFLAMGAIWCLNTEAFISDDSYFYLVISRNLAMDGYQTFSGVTPTNGAHPLWLYLLTAYSWLAALLFGSAFLNGVEFALPLSMSLLAAGCVTWWKVGESLRVHQPTLVLVPMSFVTFFGVLYSEIHLLFFTLSILILAVARRDKGRRVSYVMIGAAGAGVVLSRLDTVFLFGALGVALLFADRGYGRMLAMSLTFGAVMLPYLALNLLVFGHIVPVSGYIKSTFPDVLWRGVEGGSLSTTLEGYSIIFGIAPIVFAAALWGTHRGERIKLVAFTLIAGSVLQAAQIALFTRSDTFWYWYYLLPVAAGALTLASLAGRTLTPPRAIPVLHTCVLLGITVALAAATTLIRLDQPETDRQSAEILRFASEHAIDATSILVSDRPGYTAYHSPSNGLVAADMLTANLRLFNGMRKSPNALRYLFDTASASGRPIGYVIFAGNRWLVPSANSQCVVYNDPKYLPTEREIGVAHLGQPVDMGRDARIIVWEAANARFDVASDDPKCRGAFQG